MLPEEQTLNAPREVMRLVNWLMSNATDVVRAAHGFALNLLPVR